MQSKNLYAAYAEICFPHIADGCCVNLMFKFKFVSAPVIIGVMYYGVTRIFYDFHNWWTPLDGLLILV
jgi:hypothetical protein